MQDGDMICEISLTQPSEKEIVEVLKEYNKIAIVGLSPKKDRDSNRVARYLLDKGFEVVPVNPNCGEILGQVSYPSILDIPEEVEVVDIFRKPSAVMGIVDEAITKGAKVIWMQEGVVNNQASDKAKEAGLKVIMDRCILKEHAKWATSEKKEKF